MEITEVRIKLIESAEDRLRGFCSVTFDDCFVVRDLKIIEGNNGPFVAMPSRKLTSNCYKCRSKNHLRASFCNQCGSQLKSDHIEHDSGGRAKLYADIAHPVNARCREMIQKRVIKELNHETELASQPGYRSRYDEDFNEETVAEPLHGHAHQDKTNPQTEDLRQDPGTDIPPTPHNQVKNTESESSGISPGEFGKGIFD
ncbi:SpoVG family protein [Mariniblastus sp.]|jgi:stage V sporulation protein G|nr:SpoVG family protein [bacterium]MDA7903748.1 SpoVG family protein [Mariniblastus sp.]MDB4379951.1 SpoVG family protein [Mariniblastus sp.]